MNFMLSGGTLVDKDINTMVRQHTAAVIELRRYFHAHPEIGGQERQSQAKIMSVLADLGIVSHQAAGTGVIADIDGGLPGKAIAVRADMDALPLRDECGQSFQSVNEGVCHACGHDGHIAILLGLAAILLECRPFHGRVRLLFQPSEERYPGGALPLIAEGALAGVDAILGLHLWQPLPIGVMGLTYGKMMASSDEFSIIVKGSGGHGSMPHQTVDTILTGAQLVAALHTVVSRNVDPLEPAVLSLGVFQSGEVYNIIPETALLKGTVRSFSPAVRDKVFARIEQIAAGVCAAAGAGYEFHKLFGFPPVINHPDLAGVVAEAGRETLGTDQVVEINPVMAGEDFSYYQAQIPGVFFFIGVGNPEQGAIYPHHHPKFAMDEAGLSHGLEVFLRSIFKWLH